MKIENSHIVVTGGASGVGAAVVKLALSQGARVSVWDLSAEAGDKLLADSALSSSVSAGRVYFYSVNVVDEESVQKAVDACVKALGRIHAVIQCAGVASPCKVISGKGQVHSLNAFNKVVAINLIGTFNVLRLVTQHMRTYKDTEEKKDEDNEVGAFVHVASVAAFEGQIGQAAYSASKGGVAAMTLPLARELGDYGIRVNTVAPGIFGTPMLMALPEKARKSLSAQVPFPKRLGNPEEFADCCLHLVRNKYYNGTVIRLDGSIRMAAL